MRLFSSLFSIPCVVAGCALFGTEPCLGALFIIVSGVCIFLGAEPGRRHQ